MSDAEALAVVGMGSNVGDRRAHLRHAAAALARLGSVVRVSSLYETSAVGSVAQPPFLNAVVGVDTALRPEGLLAGMMDIERERGRIRDLPGGPRTLDLDLLFYGDRIVRGSDLIVPHPRWRERAFVRVPLSEIVPDLIDPESGWSVAEWCARVPADRSDVTFREGREWAS